MAMYQSPYMPYGYSMASTQPYMPQPQLLPTQQQTGLQTQNSGLIWVQGEQAAKSYMVGAGNSVLLMDSDSTRFYLKSADASGMPLPLRVFEYKEIQPGQTQQVFGNSEYVTRKEFDEFRAMMTKEVQKDAEPAI